MKGDRRPFVISLLATIAFFAIFLVLLRPGYGANDDIDIIAIASGYLGGKPVPFLIFSNVILGFALNWLYALHPQVNWEVLVFIAINFCSVWALLYTLLSSSLKAGLKLSAAWVVLLSDSYFLLNITFTTIAAFASIAGFFLILSASQARSAWRPGLLAIGSGLVLASSLARIETALLVPVLLLPALVFCNRCFHLRRLAFALAVTGVLVGSGYIFDRAYLLSASDWYAFDVYNNTRSALQDTPRLLNLEPQIRNVGWSSNDLHVFIHWFFPDRKIYSLEHLQTLVGNVPAEPESLPGASILFFRRAFKTFSQPYWLLIAAAGLAALLTLPLKKAGLPLLALAASFLATGIYLTTTMKLPDRVMLPILATCAIFELGLPGWMDPGQAEPLPGSGRSRRGGQLLQAGAALLLLGATGMVVTQSLSTSAANVYRQKVYRQILADLRNLAAKRRLEKNALIVSPAHGIPLEWADPLAMELPDIQYLEMGWLTFSPVYEAVLREHQVPSLPAGFYEMDNVYLMDNPSSMKDIIQYIKEHAGVEVYPKVIYEMPSRGWQPEYAYVRLYQLRLK